jgi:hypothetical protein
MEWWVAALIIVLEAGAFGFTLWITKSEETEVSQWEHVDYYVPPSIHSLKETRGGWKCKYCGARRPMTEWDCPKCGAART